jgi:hypothetical protein
LIRHKMAAHITVYILGDATQFDATRDKVVADSDLMSNHMGSAGRKAAKDMETSMTGMSHKMGSIFTGIGTQMSNMGIPFSNVFTKMGASLSATTTKAEGLKAMLASVGKIAFTAGIAGAAVMAVEGVRMWDKYEQSLISLQTVAKNTGANMTEFAGELGKAQSSAAHFGYNAQDVNEALGNLTMALGNSHKAFNDMGLAEDLARYKGVSLSAAADALDHVFGGSTRTLLSWGININVASGRLHSLQTSHEAVAKAEQALSNVQQKHNAGMLEGVAYTTAYATASLQLKDAQVQLQVATSTVAHILEVLRDRTKGASEAFSKTFAGQVAAGRAEMHNFGIVVGRDVVGALSHLEVILAKVIDWFEKYKGAAIVLASITIGPVVIAIGYYLVGALGRLGTQLLSAGGRMNWFGLQARAQAANTDSVAVAITGLSKALAANDGATVTNAASTEELAGAYEQLSLSVSTVQLQFEGMPALDAENIAANAGVVTSISAVDGALVVEGVTATETAEVVNTATMSMLGPIALVAIAIGGLIKLWGSESIANDKARIAAGYYTQTQANKFSTAQKSGNYMGMQAAVAAEQAQIKNTIDQYSGPLRAVFVEAEAGSPQQQLINAQERAMRPYRERAQNIHTAEMHSAGGMPTALEQAYMAKLAAAAAASAAAAAKHQESITPGTKSYQENPLVKAGLGFLQSMQQALETGTIQSMEPQLQGAGLKAYYEELKTLQRDGLKSLADSLIATHKAELAYYGALEVDVVKTGINDEVKAATTQYTDQTAIISDMAAKVVQGINDSVTVATAKATAQSDLIANQAQTKADILGERGLYGLNLVAQRYKVALDQITTSYQAKEDAQSIVVAQTTKLGDAAVAAAGLKVAALQKSTDLPIGIQQKLSDMAAKGGTTLQQVQTATGLSGAQAQQGQALAIADRASTIAQDAANTANANAQKLLASIKDNAQRAEAKANALISIEQARANTEFAGSGVHIEITGINPTDAQAVASAVSWHMRTKVAR